MKSESKRKISCPPKCLARRRIVAGMGTSPAGTEVVKVKYEADSVYINKSSRFTNVECETFDQYIGGYQPLQKWLKDRKGRTLSADDISHYKRIVRALRRTAALMSEIDKFPVVGA